MTGRRPPLLAALLLGLSCSVPGGAREDAAATVRLLVHPPHATAISTLAASADGRVAATCAADDPVCIWEVATGRLLQRVPSGPRPSLPPLLALSADGTRVVVTSAPGEAVVFDVASGQELRRVDAAGATLTALAFLPDGNTVVVADDRGAITGFTGSSKKPRWQHKVHVSGIQALVVAADGGLVITGGADGAVRATTVSGRERAECDVPSGSVSHVAASSDGLWLAAADAQGGLRVWSCKAPKRPRHVLTRSGEPFVGLVFDASGSVLYGAHAKGPLRSWRIDGDEADEQTPLPLQAETHQHLVSAGPGRLLLAAEKRADVLDVARHQVVATLGTACFYPHEIETSPGGQLLLVAGSDSSIRTYVDIYDLFLGRLLWRFPASGARMAMVCSPDERHVVLTERDGRPVIVDVRSCEVVRPLVGAPGPVYGAAWSADGYRIALASGEGTITLHDAATGVASATWRGIPGTIRKVAFSPRGDLVLAATETAGLVVLDAADGKRVHELPFSDFLQGVAFGADGTTLHHTTGISSTTEREVSTGHVRALYPGKVKGKMESGHDQMVTCLEVSRDTRLLATGSWDATVCVWDAQTGKRLHRLYGHDADVVDLAFASGNERLVTLAEDRTLRFWDLGTGAMLCRLVAGDVPPAGAQRVERGARQAWCVVDTHGRHDASLPTALPFLGWTDGTRTWAFDEVFEERRSPGLLGALVFGAAHPLRALGDLPIPALPPKVHAEMPDPQRPVVKVEVENRGGGIGAVGVKLNGREVVKDARDTTVSSSAPREDLAVDLSNAPNLLPGEANVVEVSAFDAKGTARARGPAVTFQAPGIKLDAPELWVLTCGVSDYAGEALDLVFPAKDAHAMADALQLAGTGHFTAPRTHVQRLASPAGEDVLPATRAALVEALQRIAASAKANDTFVLYLAGHGVAERGDGAYRYLLAEAADATSEEGTFSDADLVAALARIPCNHRAVILDTCASGGVVQALDALRAPGGAVDRLREREGVFVLAGCAADRLAYESSIYGQGLLTYALLAGMNCGCHFKDDVYVDVARLIDYACEQVPRLSHAMGFGPTQLQLPVKADGDPSFPLGRLTPAEREQIHVVRPLPAFIRSSFQRIRPPRDTHGLESAVDAAVRRLSTKGGGRPPAVHVETDQMGGAWQIAGTYSLEGGEAHVKASLLRVELLDAEVVAELELTGPAGTPEQVAALADAIVARAVASLPK
ncbi:MAG: PQQ-binding-like beta-propeller repeat protein [Planctomycetota bacterium]